ncbi:MAG: hypothetical protein ABR525_02440 [Candidatus Limnocylindria bacterium]
MTVRRRLAIAGEVMLAIAGLVWSAQGLGLVHLVRSFMNDRPEWIAIGSGTFVLSLVLLWLTLRSPPRR